MFDKLVYPVLSYGSEIWGLQRNIKIERIHLNYCKVLLGVRRQTQNNFIYGELGRPSLSVRHSVNVIRYWLKIVNTNAIKYVKLVYDIMFRELETYPNNRSWVYMVKSILGNCGFNDVWLNQRFGT